MLTAVVMIAHQVSGKATRDALFLSTFDVTSLPQMFIGASVFSFVVVLLTSRLLSRFGPVRIVPLAFGGSGLLLFGEWMRCSTRSSLLLCAGASPASFPPAHRSEPPTVCSGDWPTNGSRSGINVAPH